MCKCNCNCQTETFNIETGMGEYRGKALYFLTEQELKEFNSIGYRGKTTDGKFTNRSNYLNSLNKGKFSVSLTKMDTGDFQESWVITRTT